MKRKLSLFTFLVTIILSLVVVTGCSTTKTTVLTPTPAPTTITVTDMAGRTVVVPSNIDSIATFGSIGVLNAFVETLGCGDKIINDMSPSFTRTDQWHYQYVFAPQIANGPVFENANREIDIEAVLQAAPDLSLCMTKETATLLEGNGLTVVYLEWKELADVDECITLLGQVLDKQEIAEDYLNYFDEKVAEAEELTAGIADADKKTVLYGSVTTYTNPHVISEWWIDAAGGISVTAEGHGDSESYTYTIEDLLLWNPDVMVVSSDAMVEEVKADTRLSEVTAIVNDAIYTIPTVAHIWGNRDTEQPLTIMWMMNKLYPDTMTDEMLAEEISYFYSHFFNTELTDAQIADIIG